MIPHRGAIWGAVLAGFVLVGPVAAPARAATGIVVPVPDSIDPTGATDVSAPLNAFFARLVPGTNVQFPAAGRYRIDGTVLLLNRRRLTVDDNSSTFFAATDGSTVPPPRGPARAHWPRLRQQLRIRGGTGVTLRNLTVKGANPHGGATPGAFVAALEGQAGISIQKTAGATIESTHVSDTYGDAVYIVGGSTNVTVRNSTFERTGRQGVAIVSATHVVVEHNRIRDVGRSVFDLEPLGRAVVRDVHLTDNTIGDYSNFLLAAGGGGPEVNDIWLEHNRVDGGNGVSVYAGVARQRRSGYHVIGNTGSGSHLPPGGTGRSGLLQLANLDHVEIRDNHQGVAQGSAVSLDRVCDVTVTDNQFPGAHPAKQVVAPCGAALTSPSSRPAATPTTTLAAPERGDDSDGNDGWVWPVVVGFAAGLGVAGAGFALWRYRSRRGL